MKGANAVGPDSVVATDESGESSTTRSAAGNGLTRVTVNLTRKAVEALESISESTGYSKTDTINRALQVYAVIQGLVDQNGGSLIISSEDDKTQVKLVIV